MKRLFIISMFVITLCLAMPVTASASPLGQIIKTARCFVFPLTCLKGDDGKKTDSAVLKRGGGKGKGTKG